MAEEPILVWDECEIAENEIKHRLENREDYGYTNETDEQIRDKVYSNSDVYSWEWEDMSYELTEVMDKIIRYANHPSDARGYWVAEVNNFGWRGQNGTKPAFRANTGEELLHSILPKTDCTFKIFMDGRGGLKIQNFHHDSPCGNEWYYIRPATMKETME